MATPRPPIHLALYGSPGTKKTTLAATFPRPICVAFFDDIGGAAPYFRAIPGGKVKTTRSPIGYRVDQIFDSKGKLAIRLEYFHDTDREPNAMRMFRERFDDFSTHFARYQTLVVDSVTSMGIAAKMEQRFIVNPLTKEGARNSGEEADKKSMRWQAGATDALESYLVHRFNGYPLNVILICHQTAKEVTIKLSRDDSGKKLVEYQDTYLRGLAAPGRLGREEGILQRYAECWRTYVLPSEDGKPERFRVQTRTDGEWVIKTQIKPPNPMRPSYEEIWKTKK